MNVPSILIIQMVFTIKASIWLNLDYIACEYNSNEYNSYIHTAQNAKVTSARIVYEKTLIKQKFIRDVFRTHLNMYDEVFLRR